MDEFTDITPGKWQVMSGKEYYEIFGISGPVPRYCIVSFEDGNTEPWTVAEIVGGLDPGQEDANARLIAAAPELKKELTTALALVRLKYGNMEADVWKWQQGVEALLGRIDAAMED